MKRFLSFVLAGILCAAVFCAGMSVSLTESVHAADAPSGDLHGTASALSWSNGASTLVPAVEYFYDTETKTTTVIADFTKAQKVGLRVRTAALYI